VSSWREQYDRTVRWLDRFTELSVGRRHVTASDNYIDDVYAFFQNCYHLKDWIKNDPALPQDIRDEVERYINQTRELSICADLCNALKHLSLSNSRSRENPSFGNKHYALHLGGEGTPIISLRYEVATAAGTEDAYELAKKCVDAWTTFLRRWALVPAG
jgi:hypothetical protein